MFVAALFTQPKVEAAQMTVTWWMKNKMGYIHKMEYYLAMKKMKSWHMLPQVWALKHTKSKKPDFTYMKWPE
jgi:hypothetical protein